MTETTLDSTDLLRCGDVMQSDWSGWRYWAQLATGVVIAAAGLSVVLWNGPQETGATLLVLGTVLTGVMAIVGET